MRDYLVSLSANRTAKRLIRALRLPIPLPQPLKRETGPWLIRPLERKTACVGLSDGATLGQALSRTLSEAGARMWVPGKSIDPPARVRPFALIYDATGFEAPAALHDLYHFCHAHIRKLGPCGRIIVLARPPEETGSPETRVARRAIEGFVRSLAKEAGRKGTTAQTVYVSTGAEDRLEALLRFLLSPRSAYISGQPIRITACAACIPARKFVRPLEAKTALVTGAARGIGAATARALAREGAHVIVMDRATEMPAAERLAEAIGGTALASDITDEGAAQAILDHVAQHYDGLDIVIHNAGVTRDKTLGNMTEEMWNTVLAVNLLGLIRTNEILLGAIRNGGRIVAMSSVGGIAGNAGQTNYAATKAGLIGYVQALAPRVAERGITVNAIAPGFIETKMTAAMPMGTREVARRLCCLMQGGWPEDIAELATFLATPNAAGLTGEVVRICGGNFIGA